MVMEKVKVSVSSVRRGSTMSEILAAAGLRAPSRAQVHPVMVPGMPWTSSVRQEKDGKIVDREIQVLHAPLSAVARAIESQIKGIRRQYREATLAEYQETANALIMVFIEAVKESITCQPDWTGWELERAAEREDTAMKDLVATHPDHPDADRRGT